MTTALPTLGDMIPGRDVAGRLLRISGYPDLDRVVLSIWQDGHCRATVRLTRADVPEVTRALIATLAPQPTTAAAGSGMATVHPLRPVSTEGRPPLSTVAGQAVRTVMAEVSDRLAIAISNRARRWR